MNAACWPSPLWLYGGPYVAVSLVPASSLAAVATKSTGCWRDHWAIVLGLSSGDEKRIVSTIASTAITAIAIASLLDEVVGRVAAAPRPRVVAAAQEAAETAHEDAPDETPAGPGDAGGAGGAAASAAARRSSSNGGTTP